MSVTVAQFEALKARRDALFARVQSNAAKINELLAGSALQMQSAHDPNLRLSTPSVAGDPKEEARAAAGILQGILPIPPFDPNMPDDQRQKILGSETLAGIVHMVPNAAQAVADIFTLSNPMNPGRAEAMDRLKNKPILQTASEVLMAVGALSGTAGVVSKFARPKVVASPVIEPVARAVEAPPRTIPEAVLPEVAKPIEVMADKTPDISQPPTPAPSVERLATGDSPSAMTRAGSELGEAAQTPVRDQVSGRKRDAEAIYRDVMGEDLPETRKRGWKDDLDNARDEGLTENIENVLQAARHNDRPIGSKEHAAVVDRIAELRAEIREADQAFTRNQYSNPEAADIEMARADGLRARLGAMVDNLQTVRAESGRSLGIGRMAIDEMDGSVGAVLQRATKKKGARLSPDEVRRFEESATEINNLREQLRAAEDENLRIAAERDRVLAEKVTRIERHRSADPAKKEALKAKLAAREEQLLKELAEMGNRINTVVGPPPDALYRIGQLAVIEIRKGAMTLDEVVSGVRKRMPDLSERDVWDALNARSPKAQEAAKSAASKNLAEFKTQARLLSQIDDLVNGIETVKPTRRGEVSAQIKALQKRLADLKASAYSSNLPADRLGAAIETMDRLQDQLARQYRTVRKGKPAETAELAQVRELTGQLRRRMKAEDTIADIQEQIRTGEFKMPSSHKPYVSPELEAAQLTLRRARKRQADLIESLQPKTLGQKASDVLQTPRAAMAGGDMSGALRQNVVQMVAHPVRGVQAFTKAVKAFGSKLTDEKIHNQIENSPNALKYEQSGLKIQARDETFNSTWLENIPKLGEFWASGNRHMTTLGNVMRTSLFDDFLAKHPNATKAELQAYAEFLNESTGIGKIGPGWDKLGRVFFSPRLAWSRIHTPVTFVKAIATKQMSPRVRRQIAADFGKFLGTGMTTLAIAKLAGADVTLDPESPDFGKIRIGDKRIDIWGGFQQPTRLVLSVGTKGLRKAGATGGNLPESDKDFDPLDMMFRFLSYKFAPNITLPIEAIKGESAVGEDRTKLETAARAFTPLFIQDAYDAYNQEGLGSALTSAGLSYVGVGVNTYGDSQSTIRRQIREAKDKGDTTEARRLQQEWNTANPDSRISDVSDTRALILGDIKRAIADGDQSKAKEIQDRWNEEHPESRIVVIK